MCVVVCLFFGAVIAASVESVTGHVLVFCACKLSMSFLNLGSIVVCSAGFLPGELQLMLCQCVHIHCLVQCTVIINGKKQRS